MQSTEHDGPRNRYIRAVLAWHDVTQADLARLLGVTQANASMKLAGKRRFSVDDLIVIADAFRLDPGYLMRPPDLADVLGIRQTGTELLTWPFYSLPQVRAYDPFPGGGNGTPYGMLGVATGRWTA